MRKWKEISAEEEIKYLQRAEYLIEYDYVRNIDIVTLAKRLFEKDHKNNDSV